MPFKIIILYRIIRKAVIVNKFNINLISALIYNFLTRQKNSETFIFIISVFNNIIAKYDRYIKLIF